MHGEARVKLVYFWYAAAVALMVTWWPLRLDDLGFGADWIGLIFSGRTALAILTQPMFARLADRMGRPVLIIRFLLVAALLLSLPVPWLSSFWSLALLIWLATPFEAATTPLLDSTIVRRVGTERYGDIRAWGSLGYGVATGLFAWAVADRTPAEAGYWSMFAFLGAYLAAVLCSIGLNDPAEHRQRAPRDAGSIPVTAALVWFIVYSTLHWMALALFNYYYSLHTVALGMGAWVPGVAVALAIVGEVVAFLFAGRLLAWMTPLRALLAVSSVGIVRWGIVALVPVVSVQLAVQLAHFFTFGLWFAASMVLLGRFAPVELRGTIQGVFASIVFAGGSTVATLLGGVAMEHLGGRAVFLGAAGLEAASVLAWVIGAPLWRRTHETPVRAP